jgi:DNA-binding NtrC family response regulator
MTTPGSPQAPVVLIVDDERSQRELVARCVREWGFQAVLAANGQEALAVLAATPVAMVISDVRMPGLDGIALVGLLRERFPQLPVLLITAYPDIRQAVSVVKDGALDYLAKPIDLGELRDLLLATLGPRPPVTESLPPLRPGTIARSVAMQQLLQEVHLVSQSDATVLITGESGVGKEVIADLMHAWGPRSDRPIIKLNCAAIPVSMVESELFGHERGAFTGALAAREGRWKAAHGATLMLDEVGELPLPVQAKLLRALQDGSYSPVGSDQTRYADVRVIAATNSDLEKEIAERRFREDLYYRLNVVELYVPPLRERPDDIVPMARLFAAEFNAEPARLSPATQRRLLAYSWPGNVRELRNVLARSCLMARGGVILPEHLPPRVRHESAEGPPGAPPADRAGSELQTLAAGERQRILAALAHCNGNRTRAALLLGIGRRTLVYRLKSYAADSPREADPGND